MRAQDLVFNVVYPACKWIDAYSPSAIAIVAVTGATESNLGEYLTQTTYKFGSDLDSFGGGLGPFQGQKNDHDDIIKNFLPGNQKLFFKAHSWNGSFDAKRLVTDMIYAAMFCRIHYMRFNTPLPDWQDADGLANYWKDHYNSSEGKGSPERFIQCYPLVKDAVAELIALVG